MRTVRQALKDEITYPLSDGIILNKLLRRGLDGDSPVDSSVINSKAFLGAKADCLMEFLIAINFSESDISISVSDRNMILKQANWLYSHIGEEERTLDQPKVYIGPPPGVYVSH